MAQQGKEPEQFGLGEEELLSGVLWASSAESTSLPPHVLTAMRAAVHSSPGHLDSGERAAVLLLAVLESLFRADEADKARRFGALLGRRMVEFEPLRERVDRLWGRLSQGV